MVIMFFNFVINLRLVNLMSVKVSVLSLFSVFKLGFIYFQGMQLKVIRYYYPSHIELHFKQRHLQYQK